MFDSYYLRLAPSRVRSTLVNRAAFTLVEMVVVIAIIAILAALTTAAVFQVVRGQRRPNTENNMKRVFKQLEEQVKAVLSKADGEDIPANVVTMAGRDPRRARLIWRKLRLKQEFPMTFAEALYPHLPYSIVNSPTSPTPTATGWVVFNSTSNSYVPVFPSPAFPPVSPCLLLTASDLPPLPAYVKALQTMHPANQPPPPQPNLLNKPTWEDLESSICLVLALSQNRGSGHMTIDDLGPAAMDINGSGLKALVDSYGNPIAFFRYPCGNDALDATNPARPGAANAKYRDPLDSEGLLMSPLWNNAENFGDQGGVYWFEQLCHAVHLPLNGTYTPWPRYMTQVLVSTGPDLKFGLNNVFSTPGVNIDMRPDGTPGNTDNIYVPPLTPAGGQRP